MLKLTYIVMLLLTCLCLYGCDGQPLQLTSPKEKGPSYDDFLRNRNECKKLAENLCPFPLQHYCTLDVYEKRIIFIKNCMYERGWNDPYNVFSYYK